MTSAKIGVIAEEHDDIDVLYELTCKLVSENSFSFSRFAAHGCGILRKKCGSWSCDLFRRGCSHLVVIHDLDEDDEYVLRRQLADAIDGSAFASQAILIPVYEIEAWLLSDPVALEQTFGMSMTPRVPLHPETVRGPKERLRDIVWRQCKKRYINTIHNKKIAKLIRIERLAVCPSFSPYIDFLGRL